MSEIMQVGEDANGQQVALRLSQMLRITLSEVRTAGFRWNLRASKERVLSLVEDGIEPPTGGAGGAVVHHWDFRGEEAGVATIVIEYSRPWEHAARSARTFSLAVCVT